MRTNCCFQPTLRGEHGMLRDNGDLHKWQPWITLSGRSIVDAREQTRAFSLESRTLLSGSREVNLCQPSNVKEHRNAFELQNLFGKNVRFKEYLVVLAFIRLAKENLDIVQQDLE